MNELYRWCKEQRGLTDEEHMFVSAYELWIEDLEGVTRDDVQSAYDAVYSAPGEQAAEAASWAGLT